METFKVEIVIHEVRETEIEANTEWEAITKLMAMNKKELENLFGEFPKTSTGWSIKDY